LVPVPGAQTPPVLDDYLKKERKKRKYMQIICILHAPLEYENKYDIKTKKKKKKDIVITE